MEKIRVPKVEDVTLWRRGAKVEGTLHLMSHHLIFSYIPPPPNEQAPTPTATPPRARELWITYPMIAFCTYRPVPAISRQQPSIRLRCRDFTFVSFLFLNEAKARDVFETIRNLTSKVGKIERLYAFSYQAQGPEKKVNGWTLYDPMKEWRRLGVGSKGDNKGWRISNINQDYQYSPTYPALLPVPAAISDNVLTHAGPYRSRVRIPVLTYLHPVNNCSISRSSQPMVGVRGHRSAQDEKLVGAIFATSKPRDGSDEISDNPHEDTTDTDTDTEPLSRSNNRSSEALETLEDEILDKAKQLNLKEDTSISEGSKLYGAQQSNIIVDARPTVNAYAMQAVGMGSENMDNYKFATKAYLGIDNIHVMRDSLQKVIDALKESDITPLPPNRELLAKSNWLKHISNVLDGAALIARQVGIHHSHVLIHCSDGWDRTSQLSALSQICLDPYYRTMEGFIVLVEKDWLSFGHMFRHRSGFLGSERWFEIENERIVGHRNLTQDAPFGINKAGSNAFENALLSAKGFFTKQHNESRESLNESDGEMHSFDSSLSGSNYFNKGQGQRRGQVSHESQGDIASFPPISRRLVPTSIPIPYKIRVQREIFAPSSLPTIFLPIWDLSYDNEKQRIDAKVSEKTRSVWDYFLARKDQFVNEKYDSTIDDYTNGQERIILPDLNKTRWWVDLFGRTEEEMNEPRARPFKYTPAMNSGKVGSSLTGVETSEHAAGVGSARALSTSITVPELGQQASTASTMSTSTSLATDTVAAHRDEMEEKTVTRPAKEQFEIELQ